MSKRSLTRSSYVALLALAVLGCDPPPVAPTASVAPPPPGPPWFANIAPACGVEFRHHTGHIDGRYLFPESVSGGVALFDYDGDRDLDIYLVQSGILDGSPASADRDTSKLFRNLGGGRFEDVTRAAGVAGVGYGMGCACGDYDADGDIDLYVTNYGPNLLYRNNGDGTFVDVARAAGVALPFGGVQAPWSASAAFVDYDGDDDLDLVVTNYVRWHPAREIECLTGGQRDYCAPVNYEAPAGITLYRNNGDGVFAEVTEAAGLRSASGTALGVACADYNKDRRVDIYIANDGMANQLFLNLGDGRFTECGALNGCALNQEGVVEAGMGVAAVDADADDDLDLFVTNMRSETNTFYRNDGKGVFDDATAQLGLAAASRPFTGFGLGFHDFNNDGRLELYVANGAVTRGPRDYDAADPYAEPNQLYRWTRANRFEEVFPRGGTAQLLVHASRGAAFGDLDNDGGVDIVVANRDAAPYVLRNIVEARSRWIALRVLNRRGVDAVGAVVIVEAGGARQIQSVAPSFSYCASSDPRLHFGLGNAPRVERVTVRWLSGADECFGPFDADKSYELRAEKGRVP
ncbi:MAG: CRTAC1 family protein [Planctomycetota bacterium]